MKETKTQKILKGIIVGVCIVLLITFSIYFVEVIINQKMDSYFIEHFVTPITMFCFGLVALILPILERKRSYSGDSKGEKLMKIVGIALIIISIVTLITSF